MSRETKIGLLVGMALIIMIGVLISDHLSGTPQPLPPHNELEAQPHINAEDPAMTSPELLRGPERARQPLPPSRDRSPQPDHIHTPRRNTSQLDLNQRETVRDRVPQDRRTTVTFPGRDAERIEEELSPNELRQRLISERQSGIPEYHDVQQGEVLSLIAQKHYGSSRYYHQIFEANKDVMDNPGDIYEGMRLKLPRIPGVQRWVPEEYRRRTPAPEAGQQPTSPSPGTERTVARNGQQLMEYTIREGDGLFRLALRFYGSGSKSNELYQLNRSRIADPDRLTVGQVILVPKR